MIYEPIINRVTVRVKMLLEPRTNNGDTISVDDTISETLLHYISLSIQEISRRGRSKKKKKGQKDEFLGFS